MGKYLSPSSLENIQTKCAIIFYPDDDGAFFLNAVRGQLSELARPFIWEGDRAKQDDIAQLFTVTDLMTDDVFFGLDCELIDLITGEEEMNINVNCGCCAGSSGTTLICYDNNGQPTINTDPYTPDDGYPSPTGGDWPMNPDTQPAPTGFDDWSEYDTNACAAANAYYELLVFLVAAAYGIVDLAVTLAATIVGVAALFPAQVAEVLASPWIAKFAESLVKLATHSEDAKDWIAEVQSYLDDNQEDIVCGLYTYRHDIPGMKIDFINKVMDYMVSVLTLDAGDLVVLRDWLEKAMPFDVLFTWYVNAANWTLLTVDAIDCSACAPEALVGFTKPVGTDTVTTFPTDSLTYNGINWIGGVTWSQAGSGNRISYAYGLVGTARLYYDVTLAVDSGNVSINAIVNTGGGTRVEELVSSALAGERHFGFVDLAPGESINSLNCAIVSGVDGAKLTEFTLYGVD